MKRTGSYLLAHIFIWDLLAKPRSKGELAILSGVSPENIRLALNKLQKNNMVAPCGFGEKPSRGGHAPLLWQRKERLLWHDQNPTKT